MTKIVLTFLLVALLSGCSSTRPGDFCLVSDPIRPSSQDDLTEGTARQILTHNEYGAKVCAWRP